MVKGIYYYSSELSLASKYKLLHIAFEEKSLSYEEKSTKQKEAA